MLMGDFFFFFFLVCVGYFIIRLAFSSFSLMAWVLSLLCAFFFFSTGFFSLSFSLGPIGFFFFLLLTFFILCHSPFLSPFLYKNQTGGGVIILYWTVFGFFFIFISVCVCARVFYLGFFFFRIPLACFASYAFVLLVCFAVCVPRRPFGFGLGF